MDIKITKNDKRLTRDRYGRYVLNGDLVCNGNIIIELDNLLLVTGRIEAGGYIEAGYGIKAGDGIKAGYGIKAGGRIEAGYCIEAGYGIKAGGHIEAGWGIEAGGHIEAGWGIKAGYSIKAGDYIDVKKRIFAGTSVYRTSSNCDKTIMCSELRSGEIAYGELIITKKEEYACDKCIHRCVCKLDKPSPRILPIRFSYEINNLDVALKYSPLEMQCAYFKEK